LGLNMRYLDTGGRNPQECLGDWLTRTLQDQGIVELRLQTGYFSLDGASLLIPVLDRFAKTDCATKILIGSNDGCTLKNDIAGLMQIVGIPRANGHLGIVSFAGAYFHPKTYHVRRQDGTEAAFVGSANLTSAGLTLNVEAGIALDSREGDDPRQLSQIAAAIDAWFNDQRDGLTLVTGIAALNELADRGVLAIAPPPKPAESGKGEGGASSGDTRPRLKPIFSLPPVKQVSISSGAASPTEVPDLPEEALQEDSEDIVVEVASPAPAQDGNYQAFLMTLQKTDVGVGQVTKGASRRSPEIFIPLAARDTDPDFWGWPSQFAKDITKPGKMDRSGVKMRIGTTIIDVNMMTWPDKSDFRLRSEHLRSAGSIGDILYMERSDGKGGFTYYVEVIPQNSARHAQYLMHCINPTKNSKKLWGYI
jgi:hypothetical protein